MYLSKTLLFAKNKRKCKQFLETVEDCLCKLAMKPHIVSHMTLVEIRIFPLYQIIYQNQHFNFVNSSSQNLILGFQIRVGKQ